MHLFKCTNRFELVVNKYFTQPYHSSKAMYCKYRFFDVLLIEPSRDSFAIDWFEMSGRRDKVENLETDGMLQIEPQKVRVEISYYRML